MKHSVSPAKTLLDQHFAEVFFMFPPRFTYLFSLSTFSTSTSVCHMHEMPIEAREGIRLKLEVQMLEATMWVLRTERGSSAGAAGALNI